MTSSAQMRIAVGKAELSGWTQCDLDSDIFTPADAFSFTGPIPGGEVQDEMLEGTQVSINLDGDVQMAGVIDTVAYSGNRTASTVTVSGRDRVAFLVDTEVGKKVGNDSAKKLAEGTIKSLGELLIKPSFGINPTVMLSNTDNVDLLLGKKGRTKKTTKGVAPAGGFSAIPKVPRTKLDPGRTRASILDEHTRRLGLIWWLSANGQIFIGKPNYGGDVLYNFIVHSPGHAHAGDNNVESWSVTRSVGERFSEIIVYAQGRNSSGQFLTANDPKSAKFAGIAVDPELVARGIDRKLIIADNDIASQDIAQRRANFEMGMRRMQGYRIEVTVPGFSQFDLIYTVDTSAQVVIDEIGLSGKFYVAQRRFISTRQGDKTSLTLFKPKFFLP